MRLPYPPSYKTTRARSPAGGWLRPCAGALLASLCLLTAVACGGEEDEGEEASAPPPVPVRAAEARRESVVYYDRYPGAVSPLKEVEVRPTAAGYITGVHFDDGQDVREGQRLYTIDTRQYTAQVTSSRADVDAAQADLALAERDVQRYRRLAEAEAVSQQRLDQAEAQLEARRQALNSARAREQQAETQLDYATIQAPISGRVGLDAAKQGTQVSPGQPVLTTVSQIRPAGVDFSVPQDVIPRISRAEASPESVPDSMFRIRLSNDSLYEDFGRVFALDRAVDPATGTLETRLVFDNEDGVLRPGMNVQVEVLNANAGTHVTIPATALAEQMGEAYVFVLRDSLAHRQKVSTGVRFRDRVTVEDGLEVGEVVLTAGLNQVRDSTKVVVQEGDSGG